LDDTDAYSDISSRKGGRSAGHTGSDIGSPVSGTKLPRVQTHLVSWIGNAFVQTGSIL